MGWIRTLSVNCVTLQAWKFRNFAVLSIFGRQRDKRTALLCCVEWQCQIMSWKDYTIGILHYNWPMSAHASQAFST